MNTAMYNPTNSRDIPLNVREAVTQALMLQDIARSADGTYAEQIYHEFYQELGADRCTVHDVNAWLLESSPNPFIFVLLQLENNTTQVKLRFHDYPQLPQFIDFDFKQRAFDKADCMNALFAVHKTYMDAKAPISAPRTRYTDNELAGARAIFVERAYTIRLIQYNASLRLEDFPPSMRGKAANGDARRKQTLSALQ